MFYFLTYWVCIAICGMKYEYEKCLLNKSIQKGNSILYMGYITKRMNICFLELYGRLRSWAWFLLTVSSLKEGALLLLLLLSRFSCVRLCNCRDGSPPGSSVHGIFQARVLEWGATVNTTYSLECRPSGTVLRTAKHGFSFGSFFHFLNSLLPPLKFKV